MDSVVSAPVANGDFAADAARFSAYWLDAKQRLARLGPKPKRDSGLVAPDISAECPNILEKSVGTTQIEEWTIRGTDRCRGP